VQCQCSLLSSFAGLQCVSPTGREVLLLLLLLLSLNLLLKQSYGC
jgi:hypothetical protein